MEEVTRRGRKVKETVVDYDDGTNAYRGETLREDLENILQDYEKGYDGMDRTAEMTIRVTFFENEE